MTGCGGGGRHAKIFTIEIYNGLGSLVGYPATLVDWEPLTRKLKERCPGESSSSMHGGEGYVGVSLNVMILSSW